MIKAGAAYHQVGYQTYLQWMVEQQLKIEQRYYGWQPIAKGKYVTKTVNPVREKAARKQIYQVMRVAKRKLARELAAEVASAAGSATDEDSE